MCTRIPRLVVKPLECFNRVSNLAKLISYYSNFLIKKKKIKILAIDQLIIAGICKYTLCTSSILIKCIWDFENINTYDVLWISYLRNLVF